MKILQSVLRLARYPTAVCIISSMRSGSTLLKSLIATAPDTSDLPEVNFQNFAWYNRWKINLLSSANIIVMKFPRAFHHDKYPIIPRIGKVRNIVLVRDVYATVQSLSKMIELANLDSDKKWSLDKLANTYWYDTNANLLKIVNEEVDNTLLIRYEDLVDDPIATTKKVFEFIGSKQCEGVDSYSEPINYDWSWGSDDGGEVIKSLKVQRRANSEIINQDVKNIKLNHETEVLRRKLGYLD